jgi:hypothetical protein
MDILAQSASGATSIGGKLVLASGSGTSTNGSVVIQSGNTTVQTIGPNANGLIVNKASAASELHIRSVVADYTVDASGPDGTVFVNKASAAAITLPAPSIGRQITIRDNSGAANTNNITISPHASEKINGASTSVINTAYGVKTLVSDGTNWFD